MDEILDIFKVLHKSCINFVNKICKQYKCFGNVWGDKMKNNGYMGIIRMEHEHVYEDNLNTHVNNVTQNYM